MHYTNVVRQPRIKGPQVGQSAVAAQEDRPVRCNLRAKAEIASPPRHWRKQMRQPAMLKIRKPCDRRQRQAPSEEARRFEHHIDLGGSKRLGRLTVEPERNCTYQARMPSIEGGRS
ncbi:hypothetical protein [Bradyrhizobium sp. ARR65]|uniref:hypothetical protein n=1 Tax=Bradyrhizobium sp. ARR65 TaxID=1040989 RepID=UPI001FD951FA|nr:hypothetical protein [Bradyrhizobium sp. ARR65]